ncbi:MAG: hypothetical protein K0S08_274 [Gammaproteobacteria bacterium]|nr:hypothetical protein [Gammaproteobacteria bacterium]
MTKSFFLKTLIACAVLIGVNTSFAQPPVQQRQPSLTCQQSCAQQEQSLKQKCLSLPKNSPNQMVCETDLQIMANCTNMCNIGFQK